MLKIEDVSAATLKAAATQELHVVRWRFAQVFDRFYVDPAAVSKANPCRLTRLELLNRYVLLRKEMRKRGLRIKPGTLCAIDAAVEKRMAKAALAGIDVAALPEIVLEPCFVAIVGSMLRSPASCADVEIVVAKASRDPNLESGVSEAVAAVVGKPASFVYEAGGPSETHIAAYDLVLRPRASSERVRAKRASSIEKKLTEAEQRELEEENARIRENKKTPAAKTRHKFKPAKFTAGNGHPRCLLCGDEEPMGGICDGVAKADRISKPEVTENYVRLPVREKVEGHELRTIDVSEEEGIKALYDVNDKAVVTYLFDADRWTMEEARAWVKEHKHAAEGVKKTVSIIKVDEALRLVGGIIYEPNEVDTQGDFADEEEIGKAMRYFMEKYAESQARVKIMHEGKPHTFPVIECFQPEQDMRKGGKLVKKGSWWMMFKVTDDRVWKAVQDGTLTGFSMGGRAQGTEAAAPTTADGA